MTTLAQAVAARGINEQQELKNLKRRARYHGRQDRPKVWADSSCPTTGWRKEEKERDAAALATLKTTTDIAEYVRAWCILNRLVL